MLPVEPPPPNLGDAGRELWRRVIADLPEAIELDQRDRELLASAGALADRVVELETAIARDGAVLSGRDRQPRIHPAVSEARQTRVALMRILGSIDLDEHSLSQSPMSRATRDAARKRWAAHGPSRRSAQRAAS